MRLDHRFHLLLCWLSVCLALVAALALTTAYADDPLDARVREIALQLKCPVCQNITVADSSSEMAAQMRAVIRRQLQEGKSDAEIIAYFVERYGEGTLMAPPMRGIGLVFWLLPGAMLAVGGGLVYRMLRGWQHALPEVTARQTGGLPGGAGASTQEYERRVMRQLDEEGR